MMALYFQILANSELDIELYGKAIYMHYEFRGGEGRGGEGEGKVVPILWSGCITSKINTVWTSC